ncbi:hypothetical protein K466DRAFT_404476 [Polyporus arcularius HHB13444]|uniref:Uncharacterized protein n=1 Tax=Polyporus arcularius HHB13444 TaxID=1314778 RepID=A0A5C3PPD3_9APHY|nr:hypothetical protein K466DRAFT_404476 [Polyporus arcularius HHB13444]
MNRRKKGGNNSSLKPSAPPKPAPPTSTTPATATAMPPRASPPLKSAAPPQSAPPPPRAAPQPARTAAAPTPAPRATAAPAKPPMPTPAAMRTTAQPAMAGPSQRARTGVLTRSDRVRVTWMEFDEAWVKPHQEQVQMQLETLLRAAEQSSRVKGKALEQNQDRIISRVRREFALAARAEWETRLEKAHLRAEDWTDMTEEEMFAVEQVLSCEEEEDPGVYALAQAQQRQPAAPTLSGKTAVDLSPPLPSHSINGRNAQAPPPHASHKTPTPAAQPQPSSWFGWASKPFQTTVDEVPEEPQPASWGTKKDAPIIEEIRAPTKATPAPQPPPPAAWQSKSRAAQPAAKAKDPVAPATAPSHGFVTYAVPISLLMSPFDGAVASDAEFLGLVDNAYVNSLRTFHKQAAEADAVLARELRKSIPADEREFCIRSHMVAMEQLARSILENRDSAIADLLRSRGFGGGKGSGDTTPTAKVPAVPVQPPGAFPDDDDDGIHVSAVFEQDLEPELEPERELDPDVDEEIIIPLKGKAAKRKGKKVADVKATTNGRSTPTPAAAARPAPPAAKAAPAPEKKAAATGRPASPAPITINTNTKFGPNARNPAAPMSPWEAAQAAKAGKSASGTAAEVKPPSPPNGMWAPPMGRSTSKSPYAPTRPSRLAQVHEPESPEPPSPPPTREPTGQDYVAWFAGSSSEDERDADGGLSEDEDQDDDEDDADSGEAGASWAGGILGALSGNSKWAMFGEGAQPPQRQAARSATPARGRAAASTPVPIPIPEQSNAGFYAAVAERYAAGSGRYASDERAGAGAEWMRWGAPGGGAEPSSYGAGPASYGAGPASFGTGPSGFGAAASGAGAGSAARGRPPWQSEEDDDLGNMLELTSSALSRGDGDVLQAMNTFLAAQKARETLATPVGVRVGTPSGRRR